VAVDLLTGYAYVAFFLIAGPLLIVVTLLLSRLLHPKRANKAKLTTYESGEVPFSQAWAQIPIHYYLYALLFVVFDVEALFFLVWAINVQNFGGMAVLAFAEMMVFVFILVGGLVYAWRKGALKWV
jgi:NADH:ubiquinone oxidoreductase subunit 3 (subunit A)